jgi:hypothetical protein
MLSQSKQTFIIGHYSKDAEQTRHQHVDRVQI